MQLGEDAGGYAQEMNTPSNPLANLDDVPGSESEPSEALRQASLKSSQTQQRSVSQYVTDAKVQGVTNCGCAIQK